jgi:hypothetical protein
MLFLWTHSLLMMLLDPKDGRRKTGAAAEVEALNVWCVDGAEEEVVDEDEGFRVDLSTMVFVLENMRQDASG